MDSRDEPDVPVSGIVRQGVPKLYSETSGERGGGKREKTEHARSPRPFRQGAPLEARRRGPAPPRTTQARPRLPPSPPPGTPRLSRSTQAHSPWRSRGRAPASLQAAPPLNSTQARLPGEPSQVPAPFSGSPAPSVARRRIFPERALRGPPPPLPVPPSPLHLSRSTQAHPSWSSRRPRPLPRRPAPAALPCPAPRRLLAAAAALPRPNGAAAASVM